MNGIKMSDCDFYVNEELHTVVCVIPYTENMLHDFVAEHFDWADFSAYDSLGRRLYKELRMPKSFIGKAVCAEEDEWDEELGCLIAFARAKDKCYKSFYKRANKLVQAIDLRLGDMITTLNDFGTKLESNRDALHARIKEYGVDLDADKEEEE